VNLKWQIAQPVLLKEEENIKHKMPLITQMICVRKAFVFRTFCPKGVLKMGRERGQKTRDKNKASLPQVPKNLKTDGVDEEFSIELADQEDMEALARANAANQRVKQGTKHK